MRYQITKDDGLSWIDLEPFGEDSFDYKFELGEIGNIDGLTNPSLFTDQLPYSGINISALEYNINSSEVFSRKTFRYRITREGLAVSEGELYIESVEFNNNTPIFSVQFRDYISLVIERMKSGELTWTELYNSAPYNDNFYYKDTLTKLPYGSDIHLPYQDMLGDERSGLEDTRFVLAPKVTKDSATPIPWLDVRSFIERVFGASGYGLSLNSPIMDTTFDDLSIGIPAQLVVTETSSDSQATYIDNREMDLTPFHSVASTSRSISYDNIKTNSFSEAMGGNSNFFQRTDDNNNLTGTYSPARPTNFKNGMTSDGEISETYNISTLHKKGLQYPTQNTKFPVLPKNHLNAPYAEGGYEAVVGGFNGVATLGTSDSTGSAISVKLELYNVDVEGTGAESNCLSTGLLPAKYMQVSDLDLDSMESAGTKFKFFTEIYKGDYPVQRVYWNADGYTAKAKSKTTGVKSTDGAHSDDSSVTYNTLDFNITLDGIPTDEFYVEGMTKYRVSLGCDIDGPLVAKGFTAQSALITPNGNTTPVTVGGGTWVRDCNQSKTLINIDNETNANYVERVGVKITPQGAYRASTPNDKTNILESLDLCEVKPYDAFKEIANRLRLSFILDNTNPTTPYFLVGRIDDIISNLSNSDKNLEEIVDNRLPISIQKGTQAIANIKIDNKKNKLNYDMSGRDENITVGSYEGPLYSYSGGVIQDPLSGNGELDLSLDGALFRYDLSSSSENPTKEREELDFDTYETFTSEFINPDVGDIGIRFAYINENTTDKIGTWYAQYHTFWFSDANMVYPKVFPQYKLWGKGQPNARYIYDTYLTQTKVGGLELRVTHPQALNGKPSGYYDYVVNSILLQRNAAPTVSCKILLPQAESSQMVFALRKYVSSNIHGSLYLVSLDGTNYEDGLYADATFVVLDL